MKRLLANLWLFVSFLLALLLMVSQLSVHINPIHFWVFGLMGLVFPVFLLANWALLIFWIFRWKWPFLIPFIAILLGLGTFSNFFQFPFGKRSCAKEKTVKVLTYNVHLFQQLAWSDQKPTYSSVSKFIESQDPDIFCIQEFYTVKGKLSEKEFRSKHNEYKGHIHYIVKRKETAYGLATFSKFPIVNKGEIKFDRSANACIYTDVVINNDTVRIYNIHLQSLRLKERNLRFLSDQDFRKSSQKLDEIKDISFRYRDAVVKRSQQVELVVRHIESCKYRVVVCGDFNESPVSFNYIQMRQKLNDAFVDAGRGVGHTYRSLLPSLRIDYILYSNSIKACYYASPHVNYSDHYPVVAKLIFE